MIMEDKLQKLVSENRLIRTKNYGQKNAKTLPQLYLKCKAELFLIVGQIEVA